MKKYFAILLCACVCMAGFAAMAANVKVKKASSVKQQEQASGIEAITSNSLLPGVIGLVSNVTNMKNQLKQLEGECKPTQSEIDWVNKMVKEYAMVGPESVEKFMGSWDACGPGNSYAADVAASLEANLQPCVDTFNSSTDNGRIWQGYPKAAWTQYCSDGGDLCADAKKKSVSNIYEIFGKIQFSESDYTADEISMYVKLLEKQKKCSPENISKANKEAYSSLVTGTISSLSQSITPGGQQSNVGGIMDAVKGLGGGAQGLSSFGGAALQLLQ